MSNKDPLTQVVKHADSWNMTGAPIAPGTMDAAKEQLAKLISDASKWRFIEERILAGASPVAVADLYIKQLMMEP